jgi:hypothetical protein
MIIPAIFRAASVSKVGERRSFEQSPIGGSRTGDGVPPNARLTLVGRDRMRQGPDY